MEAAFLVVSVLKSPHVCPCFGLFLSLGNDPTSGVKAARGATWRETGKRKAALSDCSQIGRRSRQAGFHAQAVVGVQGEGDGQRTVAAFVFHVIGLCPQIDQAGALLVGKEANLLGVLSPAEASVQVGNRNCLSVTDDRPDLFAWSVSEIRRGLLRLKGRPLVQTVGLVHECEDRFLGSAGITHHDIRLS